jgi:uncharacterized protein (TIGR03435 family)
MTISFRSVPPLIYNCSHQKKIMRSTVSATLLLIAASQMVSAQSSDTFEVASVKPSRPGTTFTSRLDPAQFTCTANSLLFLILSTYPDAVYWRVSGGPPWLNTENWDVAAKLPPNIPSSEEELNRKTELMLQALLADRFKLVVHREMRDQPAYGLVLAKARPKLKPSSAGNFSARFVNGRFEFQHSSMERLADWLYAPVGPGRPTVADRPVIDRTGLSGLFDFTLEWTPETVQPNQAPAGPSLFTALEELGLKLQSEKALLEYLVIDHAERPSEK